MQDPSTIKGSDWHQRDADDVARAHAVELHRGLHDDEAARRAELHGPNELVEKARRSPWRLLLDQFTDFMILVLMGAAVQSELNSLSLFRFIEEQTWA